VSALCRPRFAWKSLPTSVECPESFRPATEQTTRTARCGTRSAQPRVGLRLPPGRKATSGPREGRETGHLAGVGGSGDWSSDGCWKAGQPADQRAPEDREASRLAEPDGRATGQLARAGRLGNWSSDGVGRSGNWSLAGGVLDRWWDGQSADRRSPGGPSSPGDRRVKH